MLPSGRLRERIEIKRPTRTPNSSGGYDTVLSSLISVYSEVTQLKASNDLIASQANLIQTYTFKIRYRLDPVFQIEDVITWRGRDFEILGFENDIMRTWITITARTQNNTTTNGEV